MSTSRNPGAALAAAYWDKPDAQRTITLAEQLAAFERFVIETALREYGTQDAAAAALGIPARTLRDRMRRLGIVSDRVAATRAGMERAGRLK